MLSLSLPLPPPSDARISRKAKRNAFTPEEDARLVELVTDHPSDSWNAIAAHFPDRSARQCRERWSEYLNPGLRMAPWTEEEDNLLLRQIERFGHRWTLIAAALAQRSPSDIKNRWYSHLRFCVIISPMGRLEFLRDSKGKRISGKAKRKKKVAFPGQLALAAVERKKMKEKTVPRVKLPQLCSEDCERLMIEDLLKTK
jgi:hypothetical protein